MKIKTKWMGKKYVVSLNKRTIVRNAIILTVIAGAFFTTYIDNTAEPQSKEYKENVVYATTEPIKFYEQYTITGYCPCEKCCGEYATNRPLDEQGNEIVYGAGGIELQEGIHCASPLPFGTKVEIQGIGTYEVQDRTADWVAEKYNDKVIDIYFDTHEEAERFAKVQAFVSIE